MYHELKAVGSHGYMLLSPLHIFGLHDHQGVPANVRGVARPSPSRCGHDPGEPWLPAGKPDANMEI